eukprot:9089663-Pyramimonas_sp.AAC.3
MGTNCRCSHPSRLRFLTLSSITPTEHHRLFNPRVPSARPTGRRQGRCHRLRASGERPKVTVKDLFPSTPRESEREVKSEPKVESEVPRPKAVERKQRGFTEGKTWGALLEEGLPEDEDVMNESLKDLSRLDKCVMPAKDLMSNTIFSRTLHTNDMTLKIAA